MTTRPPNLATALAFTISVALAISLIQQAVTRDRRPAAPATTAGAGQMTAVSPRPRR